ncbi:serine/threonine-protein kinase [Microbispora sp. H13382]|uniref:serine/threonine-protein kinase n=1 Tax=Microbispora sp. H13382 TaxID=2729112 RepID=UPI002176041D|nr:serine/threonine-protein kinase [Microbispora sp. H13382]
MDAQPSAGDPTATHRRTIGPYVPVRRLGEGGMGIVYLARDPRGRQVALKVMRSELATQEEFRARFRKEAEAAQRVARFCTAPLLDAGRDGDRHYLVTEYVDGPDLSSVIDAQGPLSGSNLDALAVGVATALAAIHGAGIVHRDLKPSNILLSPLGPRVIDFGVAQLADTLAERTGTVIGTPSYMSPEQARGEPVTSAADVFAWGCVIAYAATGRPPFGGGAAPEVLYRVAHHVPYLTGLDERLRPLVEQALDKDPGRRPSAQRLLDRLLGREEVAVEAATRIVSDIWATPAETTRRAGAAGDGAKAGGAEAGTDRRGGRRWAPVAAVCGALAVAAAVLIFALRPFGGGTTPPKGPLASRDIKVNGHPLHVTVDAVKRRGTSVTVQWTVTMTGSEGSWWPRDLFGDELSGAGLVDPPSGSKFLPARKDDRCVCVALPAQWLHPGDVLPLWATYTGVPQDLETIGVDVPGFGLFADVPIYDG